MNADRVLARLARARLEIDHAAIQIAAGLYEEDPAKIEEEILEVRARVRALEARVSVLEARIEH